MRPKSITDGHNKAAEIPPFSPVSAHATAISRVPQASGRSAGSNRRFECDKRRQPFIACTTNHFPSSRCASAIQIVRPSESIAETQPKLEPALLRSSVIVRSEILEQSITTTRGACLPPSVAASGQGRRHRTASALGLHGKSPKRIQPRGRGVSIFFAAEILKSLALATSSATRAND